LSQMRHATFVGRSFSLVSSGLLLFIPSDNRNNVQVRVCYFGQIM
jgi:hypothetical protein